MFVDSHCHLAFPELAGDLPGVLARMRASGVEAALSVCTTLPEFPAVLATAERAAVRLRVGRRAPGFHRTRRSRRSTRSSNWRGMPRSSRSARPGSTTTACPSRSSGSASASASISARRAHAGKPLIIHTRSAAADTLRLMREEGAGRGRAASCTASRSRPRSHAQALDLGLPHLVFRHRHLQERARAAGDGRHRSARPPADRNRLAVSRAGARIGANRTSRPSCRMSPPNWPSCGVTAWRHDRGRDISQFLSSFQCITETNLSNLSNTGTQTQRYAISQQQLSGCF